MASVGSFRAPRRSRLSTAVLVIVALIAGALVVTQAADFRPAEAATASQFAPGNLISDAAFFDGDSMTSAQIQTFLQARVPSCSSSYACMTTYTQATPTMSATAYCSRYAGESSESAALILSKVGRACGVSQKSLIVLLEKEQGLITASSPSKSRFDKATGMGCPDTAGCDPAFNGFFYQVYYAASQFQRYAANPGSYRHHAGQDNAVLYHPNSACGSNTVFIENQATAGLYNYTPYQPNSAAMSNLYGTGNECSSYGNRNFWRIYSDWFGNPTAGSSLVKTSSSSAVFLLSGDIKYLIASSAVLSALRPLGPIGTVSQPLLDTYPTSGTASSIVRSPSGTISLIDGTTLRKFPTCTMVGAFGGSCSAAGYTQLQEYQVAEFAAGTVLSTQVAATSGKQYSVEAGTKREILDAASATEAGLTATYTAISDRALGLIPLGVPIVRDSVFVRTRGTGTYSFIAGGERHSVTETLATQSSAPALLAGYLDSASVSALAEGSPFTAVVASMDGDRRVVSSVGVSSWPDGPVVPAARPIAVSDAFVASYSPGADIVPGSIIRGISAPTVYLVGAAGLRPIGTMSQVNALMVEGGSITRIPDAVIDATPKAGKVLPFATQIKISGGSAVYLVDGADSLIHLPSLALTKDGGISGFTTVDAASVASYMAATARLTYGIRCGNQMMIPAGGMWHPITAAQEPLYPVGVTVLTPASCGVLTVGSVATKLIRTPDGKIYLLEAGNKRHVTSMAKFRALQADGTTYLNVSTAFAALIPAGAAY